MDPALIFSGQGCPYPTEYRRNVKQEWRRMVQAGVFNCPVAAIGAEQRKHACRVATVKSSFILIVERNSLAPEQISPLL